MLSQVGTRRRESGRVRKTANKRSPLDLTDQEHMPKKNGPCGQAGGVEITQKDTNSKYLESTAEEAASLVYRTLS